MKSSKRQIIEVDEESSIQLSLLEPAATIRPDINIAKWAGYIFSSPWAKDLLEEKKIIFSTRSKKNKAIQLHASITITPLLGKKRPTTTTQRILYALVQIWEESGMPRHGKIHFSARQLCAVAGLKWAGKKTAHMTQEHLSILNGTTMNWERSFYYEGVLETQKEEMSIIDAKSYLSREKMANDEFFSAQHSIRLNQDLVDNMIAGKTKPLNYKVFVSIKNDTAIKLYNLLDNFLSKKSHWERKSLPLIQDDLELTGQRYLERRIRLAKLKTLVEALDGKELSSGKLSLSIEKTVDGSDYKLIAKKTAKAMPYRVPETAANPPQEIPKIVDGLCESLTLAGAHYLTSSQKTLSILAQWYPADMLLAMASRVKTDFKGKVKTSVIKTFMYLVHKEAHARGMEWIKDCGKDCRYRPKPNNQSKPLATKSPAPKSPPAKPKKNNPSNPKKTNQTLETEAKASSQTQYVSPTHAFSPKKVTQPVTQMEAHTQVKQTFLKALSSEELSVLMTTMQKDYPSIADKLSDSWGRVAQGLLPQYIPDFDQKVDAVIQA